MQNRKGQQVGNYRLTRRIGQGGYAEVYLAEHIYVNKQRAIKLLTGTNLRQEQQKEFLAEARTIADLGNLNSHIVRIDDCGIESGVPYLVMEYAPGGTLRNLYPRGRRVPLKQIVLYVNHIAEALQCAHDHTPSIVHCDVKPENMLLRSHDNIALSDFGIAVTGQNTATIPSQTQYLTEVIARGELAKIPGTVAYIAPERILGHTRRASDQYSLGIVVYEWLCGFPPFGGTELEICRKHMQVPPPPLHPTYSHITKEIEDVVMRALAKEPDDRYKTVWEFAQSLEKAAGLALPQHPPAEPIGQPTKSRVQIFRQVASSGGVFIDPAATTEDRNIIPPSATPRVPWPLSRKIGVLLIALALLIGSSLLTIYFEASININASKAVNTQATLSATHILATQTTQAKETATTLASSYPFSTMLSPRLYDRFDSGSFRDEHSEWDDYSTAPCNLTKSGYFISEPKTAEADYASCFAENTNFTNFTYQADIKITQGDCAGIIFRADKSYANYYFFAICLDGYYIFGTKASGDIPHIIKRDYSSFINKRPNVVNVIAVVARDNIFKFIVNGPNNIINTIEDENYSQGRIGVIVYSYNHHNTEVLLLKARVWLL